MRAFALLVVAVGAVAACGADERSAPQPPQPPQPPRATAPATTPAPARDVRRARCPEGVPDCRAVRGTVIFVEPVDPDGDGDLHVVLSGGSVTGPGLTAVDVAPERRPRRDLRVGDRASAAGPVQTGSYGQSQIHALEFRTARG